MRNPGTPPLITVFGGGGFIGRYVCETLLKAGARIRVAERHPRRAWFLQPLGSVGQFSAIGADLQRPETIAAAVEGADAVINLVGVLQSRRGRPDERGPNNYGPDFAAAHVEVPQAVVAACRALRHRTWMRPPAQHRKG